MRSEVKTQRTVPRLDILGARSLQSKLHAPPLMPLTSLMSMQLHAFDVAACRAQFPGLKRQVAGKPAVYFDGPAGSQVPQRVIDAVANYLAHTNANHGGVFASSFESDAILDEAQQAVADFLGCSDPAEVSF